MCHSLFMNDNCQECERLLLNRIATLEEFVTHLHLKIIRYERSEISKFGMANDAIQRLSNRLLEATALFSDHYKTHQS